MRRVGGGWPAEAVGTDFDAQEQEPLAVPKLDTHHGPSGKNSDRHCIRLTTSLRHSRQVRWSENRRKLSVGKDSRRFRGNPRNTERDFVPWERHYR